MGRGRGELVRGCRAALSQEAGLRPQRKGGSVGRKGLGVVGVTSVGGGMVGSEVRSGRPAVRVQRSRSWWLKAQAPPGRVHGCCLGRGPGSRVLHLPAPALAAASSMAASRESNSLGPPEPLLVRVYA